MEYTILIKIIGIILLSILFIYSGIHKIFNFNTTSIGFNQKVKFLDFNIAQVLIIIAILILLISPVMMLFGVYKDDKSLLKYGSAALIVFTIVATIIYHPITEESERYNMLKNISIIGGLLLVN